MLGGKFLCVHDDFVILFKINNLDSGWLGCFQSTVVEYDVSIPHSFKLLFVKCDFTFKLWRFHF